MRYIVLSVVFGPLVGTHIVEIKRMNQTSRKLTNADPASEQALENREAQAGTNVASTLNSRHVQNWSIDLEPWESAPWDALSKTPGFTPSQSAEWWRFIQISQNAQPVTAKVLADGELVAYFVGAVVSRMGLRILGSPFQGWATGYVGLILLDERIDRASCYASILPQLCDELKCVYAEVVDGRMTCEDAERVGLTYEEVRNQFVDLSVDEKTLLGSFSKSCRRTMRDGRKNGLVVVETDEPETFAARYHEMLLEVFAKQSLVPTYSLPRVQALIDALYPSGQLLLLETRHPDGRCLATGLFLGTGTQMECWGSASVTEWQRLRPNELLISTAMTKWRDRGALECDLGGWRAYKEKYRPETRSYPRLQYARFAGLLAARDLARRAVGLTQRVRGAVRKSQ